MNKDWWKSSAVDIPRLVTETPGPESEKLHVSK